MRETLVTLKRLNSISAEIKKSRFIASACRAESPEEALEELRELSDPEATHNCWAYRIDALYRFSDDGEPGGSAGRPILAAIEGQGLNHVLVVVTRHYGGTKLGVGGLVRAYGGTAAECLRTAERIELKPKSIVTARVPFTFLNDVYSLVSEPGFEKVGEEFDADGLVLRIELESERAEDFESQLRELTNGRCQLSRTDLD